MTLEGVAAEILLDVRTQLEEAAAEMDATLRQAASAGSVGRHGGSAAGYHAGSGSLILGGRESHPLLLEATAETLVSLSGRWASQGGTPSSGDLYWTNDPRCGAAGLEDLVIASPVVREGRMVAFTAVVASHTALGRATLAPVESLRREGLIVPWGRLGHDGVLHTELLNLLVANAETPVMFLEDLQAQIHALRLGHAILEMLIDRYGPEVLAGVRDALAVRGRDVLRDLLDRLEAQELEGHAAPFAVRIKREPDGVQVLVDIAEEVPDLRPTPALARMAVRGALREVLAAEMPALGTGGGWTGGLAVEVAWDVSAPGMPVSAGRFGGAQRLAEATLAAFAGSLPHLIHAPDTGPLLVDLRGERTNGTRYHVRLELGGGSGASVLGDGLTHSSTSFQPQRLRSVEAIERSAPLRVSRFELRPDSAGSGQYRGGLGASLELVLLEGRGAADLVLPGRCMGSRGGMRGEGARLLLVTPEDGSREVPGPARITLGLRRGDRLLLESPGGGGWGLPFQRSIMRVEEDLVHGLVTPQQARSRYGVIVKPGSLEKDDHLTYRVRHYLLSTLAAEDIMAGEELLD